ncbi:MULTISPECIES: DUF6894 family protein [Rhizobium]|jgi:protocatechuate 3,4-dioxygenase beta subunit|uniref:DUF6894 domain-containing protein n=2 Tax=Rhizobium TaxID=379 RepID=A0AB38I6U1_9HYPH|nr:MULTISPECIES: hypothetical protein [Rhizobium]TCA16689.1 hypothetical protein E0H70_34665 [Rhizobium leguminosarum bv. viciae]MBY5346292.1 hypothetical protein [Rhizobium leguminosarum]MBY5407125.1 hypothetical protein [Rhizobium leguminosarum]NEI08297.1 hypothetical protein [Rhizobium ruizarguesonis]NEI29142.1 hypothetical protein [Rhizobium ruizarguesonis]
MPRYYFDLHNEEGPTRDEHGTELKSREDIPKELTRILLDVARDELPAGDRMTIAITVRDESGDPVTVASLIFNNEWLDVLR